MWLTEQLYKTSGLQVQSGLVGSDDNFSVQGEKEFRSPERLSPYGLSSRAASGDEALMLGSYCAGVLQGEDGKLQAGEVRLYSAGGAEVLLKNNGDVVINGQVFTQDS